MKNFVLVLIILLSFQPAFAQHTVYKNLVLEGGGIRGFAYAGAFEILDSLHLLKHIERVGGTSAGAIQATLLAVGYTPKEMTTIAANIPLKKFNDGFFPGGLSRLKRRLGFFKGNKLTAWMEQLIAAKTGDGDITFRRLHEVAIKNNYKQLYITGTDLTYRCLRVFCFETYPEMKVKDALRISFSIPLYFEPVVIDDKGAVQKNNAQNNFHTMVDGGLLSNYPITMFDFKLYNSSNNDENAETLGLLLDKPEQVSFRPGESYPLPVHSLAQYVSAVYQTLIDKPNPDRPSLQRTITISHLNLSGMVRKLSPATIQKLVESGRQGVRRFFVNR
ncbi:MAG: patatin-like phospholipase family protein [Chitinophagaceae bacterium]|nr:patatin-like phospholipase family protein [Chitinophagaceae bacterium]